MNKQWRRLLLVGAAGASLLAACSGEITGDDSTSQDGTISSRARLTPEAAVKAYLRGKGKGKAADQMTVASQSANVGGLTHIRMEQNVDGFRVHGVYVKATVDGQANVVHAIDRVAGPSNHPTPSNLRESDALAKALAELGYDANSAGPAVSSAGNVTSFGRGNTFHRDPSVERVAYVDDTSGALREGFLVETWSIAGNQLDYTLIDNKGGVASVERRTANDRYNVFKEDPLKGDQTIVTGPGTWLRAVTQTTINITGQNAHAYLDTDANNAPDSGGGAATTDFLAAINRTVAPNTTTNKEVAVQNLFYLNNTVHDILYGHGFDEAAGNFQFDNGLKGGVGGDPVNAEAQDGSGTDNANFSTPADGQPPRMQMYLWTGAGPNAFVFVDANTKYGAYQSSFGAQTFSSSFVGLAAATPADGCSAVSGVSGKIAIVDRGTCNFTVKVLNAQQAGAVAVVIANNSAGTPFSPGGTDRKVKIPSVMVSQADGATLRSSLPTANLRKNTVVPLQIDGDIDADVVFHEYGHGLSWRMIGSMSGPISGAIGEGSSDVVAFLINGDPIIGEYAASSDAGIRRAPYDNYTLSYADVNGAEVHNDGEIFAAAVYAVYQNYVGAGLSADDLLDDYVQAMNYIPAAPSYEAMRDGLLEQVNQTQPTRACLVWRGFAKLGIGVGSKATVSRRGVVTTTPSRTVPSGC